MDLILTITHGEIKEKEILTITASMPSFLLLISQNIHAMLIQIGEVASHLQMKIKVKISIQKRKEFKFNHLHSKTDLNFHYFIDLLTALSKMYFETTDGYFPLIANNDK